MAKYKLTQDVNTIKIVETNTYFPLDPANTDYQEYLEWVADGGVPEEADA